MIIQKSTLLQKWLAYNHQTDRNFYACRVACPHCTGVHTVAFAGWSALRCTRCGEDFGRPKR